MLGPAVPVSPVSLSSLSSPTSSPTSLPLPGGDAWHPANRKVKVSLFVRELGLSPLARERLLALVGSRYDRHRDELTLVSER